MFISPPCPTSHLGCLEQPLHLVVELLVNWPDFLHVGAQLNQPAQERGGRNQANRLSTRASSEYAKGQKQGAGLNLLKVSTQLDQPAYE